MPIEVHIIVPDGESAGALTAGHKPTFISPKSITEDPALQPGRFRLTIEGSREEVSAWLSNTAVEAAVAAAETERRRVAQELHDGLCQYLTQNVMYVERWAELATAGKLTLPQFLDNLREMMVQCLEETRQIIHNLTPAYLTRFGLVGGLERLCQNANVVEKTCFELHAEGPNVLDAEHPAAHAVFRIVQELISNTMRHAGAAHAVVRLTQQHQLLSLAYWDDGAGCNLDAAGNGHGLHNIRNRAALLSGTLQLTSAPGQGFELLLHLPL